MQAVKRSYCIEILWTINVDKTTGTLKPKFCILYLLPILPLIKNKCNRSLTIYETCPETFQYTGLSTFSL